MNDSKDDGGDDDGSENDKVGGDGRRAKEGEVILWDVIGRALWLLCCASVEVFR